MKDKYKEPTTIVFPKMVARVYRPILELEERKKRIKTIHMASAKLLEGVTL